MNLYKSAASALDHLDAHQGSVKGSLAAAGIKASGGEARRILALLIETLKYRDVLKQLLTTVPVQKLEKEAFPRKSRPSSSSLLQVMVHDLLFSPKGKIECSDKVDAKAAILKHGTRLKAELVRIQIKAGKSSIRELGKEGLSSSVRYIRFNPRRIEKSVNEDGEEVDKWTLDDLHNYLQGEVGLNLLPEARYPVPKNSYFMDPHLPDYLLVFESGSNWWLGSQWYERGSVILQDKASCMPAAVIMAEPASSSSSSKKSQSPPKSQWEEYPDCIDGTSAPGNKTSLMSALSTSNIYAFEKSPQRFKTLERMLKIAGCDNVQAQNEDFTSVDPNDYPTVGRILLDPSCSGSGIVNRLDYLVDGEEENEAGDQERLDKLAGFQVQMLQHALKFPNVTRIVYSTCSIHKTEDESVVSRILAYSREHPSSFNGERYAWVLEERSNVLPKWERRGLPDPLSAKDADKVIRCAPEDHTNGFFVACFKRIPLAELPTEVEADTVKAEESSSKAEKPSAEAGGGKTKKAQVKGEDKAEGNGRGKKRPAEDVEEAEEQEEETRTDESAKPKKQKTAAQLERAKRKKKAQKAKAGR
ncbi:nucleus protein [Trichosporon asahii var. asahii CBS 2479]|uniref:Nucleus protein n=1 Tax=Trichosporon asahii var. asahii (strain ATCC 90039 / CBS 2479 / JCM 2466 / KCTC 7840 / NBRC 103889/ NCYC 2677 / UAMH 7654) TaxID=1186058 RepID=J6FB49_TRIAS|nr:nucleus protein [Trichosporon asahii var. asahii CBS 2479]EJT52392.1 nucleus protein [Trichosporon asahii var. asahii CBS 2479]